MMNGRLRHFFDVFMQALTRPFAVLTCIAGAAGLGTAALLLHDRFSLLYYGDAAAHLVRTRQFIDSMHPGLDNIGTVWLPVPHLLLLPFISVDPLFRLGLAGACIGIPALVMAAWFLYDGARRLTGSPVAAAAAALVFGLNPNVLYLAVTPMTESVFFLFFTGALYALYRWRTSPGEFRWLALASGATVLATLSRYEAWPMPGILAAAVLIQRGQGSRPLRARGKEWLALAASCAGIAAWLLWNWHLYGDPFRFLKETEGAGFPWVRDSLRGQPHTVFRLFFGGVLHVFGPLLPGLLAWLSLRTESRKHMPMLLPFLIPASVTLGGMMLGYVQMDHWGWNVRYVLVLAPVAALVTGLLVADVHRMSPRTGAGLFLISVLGFCLVPLLSPVGTATYRDATRQFHDETLLATEAGRTLGTLYEGGGVVLFTGYGQGQRIMMPSGLDLRNFAVVFPGSDREVLTSPWRSHRYMFLALRPALDAGAHTRYWLEHLGELSTHYVRRWSNRDFLLLQRRESPVATGAAPDCLPVWELQE